MMTEKTIFADRIFKIQYEIWLDLGGDVHIIVTLVKNLLIPRKRLTVFPFISVELFSLP